MSLHRQILHGDVLEKIKEIPDETIDIVVTSPAYYCLRNYGEKGQWGLEENFNEYLDKLMVLMDQLRRVLKPTGTVWMNIGDTYAEVKESWHFDKKPKIMTSIKNKSQFGIPQRFYIRCIDDGWIARNWVTWMKNNSMPFSGKDRLKNMTEPVMFFAKEQKYYFDLDPVRRKMSSEALKRKPHIIDKTGQQELFPGGEGDGIQKNILRNLIRMLQDYTKKERVIQTNKITQKDQMENHSKITQDSMRDGKIVNMWQVMVSIIQPTKP